MAAFKGANLLCDFIANLKFCAAVLEEYASKTCQQHLRNRPYNGLLVDARACDT